MPRGRTRARFDLGDPIKPVVHRSYAWFFWFILVLFLFTFIVLAFVYPADPHYHYQPVRAGAKVRKQRSDCTTGEIYDDELQLCAPKTNTPIPVLPELYDLNTDICNSFYQHSCGNWIRNHTNEDRSFTYVYRKNKKHVYDIISSPDSGPVYTFFRSCLDTLVHGKHHFENSVERKHLLEQTVERLKTYADIPVVFARLARYGYVTPFTVSIESHPTKPQMIPLVTKNGFYSVDDAFLTLKEYAQMEAVVQQLNLWYVEHTDDTTFQEYVQRDFPNDVRTFASFKHDKFWKEYFIELGGSNLEHDLLLNEIAWIPEADYLYIQNILNNMEIMSIQQWKTYCKYSVLYGTNQFMPVLPHDSYFRKHDYTHHRVRYSEHQLNRRVQDTIQEHHCLALTNVMLPGMLAKQYLHSYMPNHEQIRRKVTTVVENVRDEYSALIRATDWMSPSTKQQAVEKIEAIIVRAVHPNTWETEPFSDRLAIDRYMHNLNLVRRYRVQRNLQLWSLYKESSPRDAIQRFGAPLTTVNAYYSSQSNSITIFAGIITEPFYSEQFSDVTLYATLGMIAGHELSHAMDNQGRLFDKEGSLVDWWKESDVKSFNEHAQCIVNEYVVPGGCENANYGEQTLPEDIADITGIQISYNAYFSKQDRPEQEKRWFFTIFSQVWAESYSQEILCDRVNNDVHAIALFRVDKTLRQMKEFRQAFRCSASDNMVHRNACKIYG